MEDVPLIRHLSYVNHNDHKRAYVRDAILGINDGLISTVLLSLGIYASGLNKMSVIFTLVSSSLAGVISMGLGEYLATKSQAEMTDAELELEKDHIKHNLGIELRQVEYFLRDELMIDNIMLINCFVKEMAKNKEGLFNFMKKIEFGVSDDDARNPLIAMSISGLFFFIGSFPSLLSFCFPYPIDHCIIICIIFNVLALFAIGALKTLLTKKNVFLAGSENVFLAGLGGCVSYIVGRSAKFFLG